MARTAARHSPAEWREIGRQAIMHLLANRLVVPWTEVEARIAFQAYDQFPPVQPVQLNDAKRDLIKDDLIVEEATQHQPPVTTIRLPYPPGQKRMLQRLRGERRKAYRTYLAWAQDSPVCGKHAERVVLESAKSAASDAGLWVPPQTVGEIHTILGTTLNHGPLDVLAYVLAVPEPTSDATLVIEVKNIHTWIYPWSRELWELLVKAAELPPNVPTLPLLVCVRYAWQTGQMAKDTGFLLCHFGKQVFSPDIDAQAFADIQQEFGLAIEQHDGPHQHALNFLTKTLRRSPPPSQPPDELIPWYRRQVARFSAIAPIIRRFDALAGGLSGDQRSSTFRAFGTAVRQAATWPLEGGWSA